MHSLVKGKTVKINDDYLHVELEDGRIISTPIEWYPELVSATIAQRLNYKFICKQSGLEWPDLDFHLSIGHMLIEHINQDVA
ncbi:MAG: DUF2442 domain-containing protein [SAR324 cluster bacterium]|nr:DUF2442 domain-containing protein [SAR324 cluster bacterium]MBF0351409.1 DUF2442 domain-containing protein [SAR324 cluster bacterium]